MNRDRGRVKQTLHEQVNNFVRRLRAGARKGQGRSTHDVWSWRIVGKRDIQRRCASRLEKLCLHCATAESLASALKDFIVLLQSRTARETEELCQTRVGKPSRNPRWMRAEEDTLLLDPDDLYGLAPRTKKGVVEELSRTRGCNTASMRRMLARGAKEECSWIITALSKMLEVRPSLCVRTHYQIVKRPVPADVADMSADGVYWQDTFPQASCVDYVNSRG